MKHIYENIFDPDFRCDMVSSRTVMKYGEIKPGDWERRRKEVEEEETRHTVGLFKRRAITLLMLISVCVWFRKEYFFLWFLMFFNFNFMIFN